MKEPKKIKAIYNIIAICILLPTILVCTKTRIDNTLPTEGIKTDTLTQEMMDSNMCCVTFPPRTRKNLPTRLNNIGAIRRSSNPDVMKYADGIYKTDSNGSFLRFALPQHGCFALLEVIKDSENSTVESFISRYAPKKQGKGNSYGNNTREYIANVVKSLGVTKYTKVGDCNEYALLNIIGHREGFKH